MDQRLLLITMLVKLGVAAAVASAVVRSRSFKALLFRDYRTLNERVALVLFLTIPVALGVLVRLWVRNFLAADISFESAILIGVLGGEFAGVLGGGLMALPSLLAGDYLSIAVTMLAGLAGGAARNFAKQEDVWTFSPFVDLSVYRWIRKFLRRPGLDWQTGFFLLIVLLQLGRMQLQHAFPHHVFTLNSPLWYMQALICLTAVMVVGIPLKIWNNARIELKLEEQQVLLLQARMEALQSQINPHFLFNTLNSIASLVRFDPEAARDLIVKLASILRKMLRKSEAFTQLREEIDFIDDYLSIEVVRFGRDKLKVEKLFAPETLEAIVPSMILQPLIENSIKHGLAPKIDGGSVVLRSRFEEGALVIEVQDDGVGIPAGSPALSHPSYGAGIGLSNVAERLKVLYGETATMQVNSEEGKGTTVVLRLPMVQASVLNTDLGSQVFYEARARMER